MSLTDSASASENALYTTSATATQVSVTRVSDGAVLLTDTFSGDAAWGFSPDQHRFARHSFDGSFFKVALYDLQAPNPAVPLWTYESVTSGPIAIGDTHLSFSPPGHHLLFVTLTSANTLELRLVDVREGQFHADSITFSAAPGLEDSRYGAVTWGFSRDAGDGSFTYAYTTPQNRVKWRVLNLAARSLVFDEDPVSLISAFWRFSPCGDTLGMVQQTSSASKMIRLIRTMDGEELYKGMNFPVRTVVFRSEAAMHFARVDNTDVELAPNTAGRECLSEPDLEAPTWPGGALLTFTDISYGSIKVNWPAAVDNVGVTAYRVSRGSHIATVPATARSHVFSGLEAGTGYSFSVRAMDAAGNSSSALTGNASTLEIVPTGWPEGALLMARYPWGSGLDLYWRPAEHPDGVSHYRVRRNGEVVTTFSANPNVTNIRRHISGLVVGETYTFQVEAGNADGFWSDGGPSVTIVFDLETPPSWPSGSELVVEERTSHSVTLAWTPADHPISVGDYRVFVDDFLFGQLEIPPVRCGGVTDPNGEPFSDNRALTTWTVWGLEANTTYTFRIEAGDLAGNWSDGGPTTIETSLETAPDTTIPTRDDYALIRVEIPHADSVYGRGLNEAGQVTVRAFGFGSGSFFWDNGTAMDTGHLGRWRSTPEAIDGSGRIIGHSAMSASKTVGFIWEDGVIRSLEYWSISHWDIPRAINDHGDVVGTSRYVPISTNRWHRAVLWRRVETDLGGGLVYVSYPILDLGTLGGEAHMSQWDWVQAEAVDINNGGQVVGTAPAPGPEGTWARRAFLWEDGVMTDLGSLGGHRPSGTTSQAWAINESGHVIGTSLNTEGHFRAFFWRNGVMRDLGTLGGETSTPNALNDVGVVVGSSSTNRLDCRGMVIHRAFRWYDGTIRNLGTFGGPSSSATAINNAGLIVGRADTFEGKSLPFLWEDGTLYFIGDESWESGEALHINSAGQILINASVIIGYEDPGYGEPWGTEPMGLADGGETPIMEYRVYLATPWEIAPPLWPEGAELRVTEVSATTVSLAWDEAQHRDGVSAYRLYRDGTLVIELPSAERSFEVTGLAPETTHTFKVEAGAPNGKWSGTGPGATAITLEGAAGPETFAEWLATHFDEEELADPGITDPEGDPGGHGMTNLMRYALAMDPRAPNPAGLPAFMKDGEGTTIFHYVRQRNAKDLLYAVEGSLDLIEWEALEFFPVGESLDMGVGEEELPATPVMLGSPAGYNTNWSKTVTDRDDGTEWVGISKQETADSTVFLRLRIELQPEQP